MALIAWHLVSAYRLDVTIQEPSIMEARHTNRGETRYGLAVFASSSGIGLSAYAADEAGVLKPISEEELQEEAPQWHAVLLLCRAGHSVQMAIGNLPPQIQRQARILVQVTALFGQFDNSPLLADPPPADSGQAPAET